MKSNKDMVNYINYSNKSILSLLKENEVSTWVVCGLPEYSSGRFCRLESGIETRNKYDDFIHYLVKTGYQDKIKFSH